MNLSKYIGEVVENYKEAQAVNECVIAARKLTIDSEWNHDPNKSESYVLIKHRDRAYNVNCSIVHTVINDMEIVYLRDDDTYWQEGMNANGICIINSSLSLADENMGTDKGKGKGDSDKSKSRGTASKFAADGEKIVKALTMRTLEDAVHMAKTYKGGIHGNTLFSTDDELVTFAATSKHPAVTSNLEGLNQIVFTNHSDVHPSVGYQQGPPRKSTIKRKELSEIFLSETKTPKEMLEVLRVQKYGKQSHLNPLRSTDTLVTTSQMILDPKNLHFHLTIIKEYTENFKGIVDQCPTGWEKKIKITYDEI